MIKPSHTLFLLAGSNKASVKHFEGVCFQPLTQSPHAVKPRRLYASKEWHRTYTVEQKKTMTAKLQRAHKLSNSELLLDLLAEFHQTYWFIPPRLPQAHKDHLYSLKTLQWKKKNCWTYRRLLNGHPPWWFDRTFVGWASSVALLQTRKGKNNTVVVLK